eukprot:2967879-Rhodomonas_salina.3
MDSLPGWAHLVEFIKIFLLLARIESKGAVEMVKTSGIILRRPVVEKISRLSAPPSHHPTPSHLAHRSPAVNSVALPYLFLSTSSHPFTTSRRHP